MDKRLREIADYLLERRTAAEVEPSALSPKLLPHFFILDVVRGPDICLRVRLAGTAIDRGVGRQTRTHCLEEFMHGPRSSDVLLAFHTCAETRAPVWMRQIVKVSDKAPRFVEGVAVFIEPERIYGGLAFGEIAGQSETRAFESAPLERGGATNTP